MYVRVQNTLLPEKLIPYRRVKEQCTEAGMLVIKLNFRGLFKFA